MSDTGLLEPRPAPPGEAPPVEAPIGLLAEITHRCPLQCPYCSNPLELEAPSAELTAPEWARVFEEAAALGVLQVHVSGGEPLARPDCVEIVSAAREQGLYVNLITAAVTLTPERADALLAAGVEHVQISLQDAEAAGCARITGSNRAFARKIEAAHLVVGRDLPLTLNAVVHRLNLDRVGAMIEIAREVGAGRIEIAHTQYYGWALRNRSALMPTRAQVERASEVVEEARERLAGRLAIDYVAPDYHAVRPKACMGGWGREILVVAPDGAVLPCHAAATVPGLRFERVRDRSLAEIWHRSEAFQRYRGTGWMRDPCRSCAHREEDWGGCRCQAMLLAGDAAEADPVCALSPRHGALRAELDRALAEAEGADPVPLAYRRYG
jgi:pyrroloquinoline quinone biosynthesis protein E